MKDERIVTGVVTATRTATYATVGSERAEAVSTFSQREQQSPDALHEYTHIITMYTAYVIHLLLTIKYCTRIEKYRHFITFVYKNYHN